MSPDSRAGPIDEWAKDYAAGTAFAGEKPWDELYRGTTDREFVVRREVREDDVVTVLYEAGVTSVDSGERSTQHGVAVYYLRGEKVVAVEFTSLEGESYDLAVAGQVADVATTAAGLAAGFSEGNPALSGAASPAGLAVLLAVKVALARSADDEPVHQCIASRQVTAGFGWGAAAWNVGLMLGGPALGLAGALAVGTYTFDRFEALRYCALHKLAHGPARPRRPLPDLFAHWESQG
ncbi:MAG TPA: hypothetical protein VFP36_00610 [Usitatibacter sp.]|nr:hypothetical protein [Usitatibacter sp.]